MIGKGDWKMRTWMKMLMGMGNGIGGLYSLSSLTSTKARRKSFYCFFCPGRGKGGEGVRGARGEGGKPNGPACAPTYLPTLIIYLFLLPCLPIYTHRTYLLLPTLPYLIYYHCYLLIILAYRLNSSFVIILYFC